MIAPGIRKEKKRQCVKAQCSKLPLDEVIRRGSQKVRNSRAIKVNNIREIDIINQLEEKINLLFLEHQRKQKEQEDNIKRLIEEHHRKKQEKIQENDQVKQFIVNSVNKVIETNLVKQELFLNKILENIESIIKTKISNTDKVKITNIINFLYKQFVYTTVVELNLSPIQVSFYDIKDTTTKTVDINTMCIMMFILLERLVQHDKFNSLDLSDIVGTLIMIITKTLDDIPFSNRSWSVLLEIPNINKIEKEILGILDYRVFVSHTEFQENKKKLII